jgi:hypothetical protein
MLDGDSSLLCIMSTQLMCVQVGIHGARGAGARSGNVWILNVGVGVLGVWAVLRGREERGILGLMAC